MSEVQLTMDVKDAIRLCRDAIATSDSGNANAVHHLARALTSIQSGMLVKLTVHTQQGQARTVAEAMAEAPDPEDFGGPLIGPDAPVEDDDGGFGEVEDQDQEVEGG